MTFFMALFLIWYPNATGCLENYLNERTRCGINFPDQSSIGYTYCRQEADDRFYRCLNGLPAYDQPIENP